MEAREILIQGAHGGMTGGNRDRVVEWYRWVKQGNNFANAQKYCVQLGGNLFYKVDGTGEQLDFLLEKMDGERHWVGIYTEDHIVWKNVLGDPIPDDLLLWAGSGPDNWKASQYHLSNLQHENTRYLDDVPPGAGLKSVCDLLN